MNSPADERFPQPTESPVQIEPEEVLREWVSPSRPFKKRDREYYTTIAIIVVLVSVILFFAGQFLLIAVIMSVAFMSYALASVPPEPVKHAITTYGIRTHDRLYHWGELGRFWFSTRLGGRLLHVQYFGKLVGQIILVLGDQDEEEIKNLLMVYIPHQEPTLGFVEKASAWIQQKFPLERG